MGEIKETIALLVAPVIMISACGLLCLALYNRLSVLVARMRTFNKERLEASAALAAAEGPAVHKLRVRIESLEKQTALILERARFVRNSLICLLVTVLLMLACSFALGLSLFTGVGPALALAFFGGGLISAFCGIALAILELRRALNTVETESAAVEEAT